MATVNFQEILNKLKDEAGKLAVATFKDYQNEATSDALELLNEIKDNLQTWTFELAEGTLSKADFEFLVQGQKELGEMNALKQAGLALIKADEFKNSLLNLVSNTILGLI